jgi:hypothetical protein
VHVKYGGSYSRAASAYGKGILHYSVSQKRSRACDNVGVKPDGADWSCGRRVYLVWLWVCGTNPLPISCEMLHVEKLRSWLSDVHSLLNVTDSWIISYSFIKFTEQAGLVVTLCVFGRYLVRIPAGILAVVTDVSVVFLTHSTEIPRYCLRWATTVALQVLSKFESTNLSTIWRYAWMFVIVTGFWWVTLWLMVGMFQRFGRTWRLCFQIIRFKSFFLSNWSLVKRDLLRAETFAIMINN